MVSVSTRKEMEKLFANKRAKERRRNGLRNGIVGCNSITFERVCISAERRCEDLFVFAAAPRSRRFPCTAGQALRSDRTAHATESEMHSYFMVVCD